MAESLLLPLLKRETARDKQKFLGPSDLSTPCNLCIARKFRGELDPQGPYWLGGVIGTAVHALAESRVEEPAKAEMRLVIGEIPGYGIIKGTADYWKDGVLGDWKGTTRKKLPGLKKAYDSPEPVEGETLTTQEGRFKLKGHVGQAHLYGRAMIERGYEVNEIAIEFFCRDGTGDDDIFPVRYPYDPEFAELVWERALFIYEHRYDEDWTSSPWCFACNTR